MKLLTLAKKLDFTNELEYFDYCISSYQNGNFSQSRELFKNMTKADRKGWRIKSNLRNKPKP